MASGESETTAQASEAVGIETTATAAAADNDTGDEDCGVPVIRPSAVLLPTDPPGHAFKRAKDLPPPTDLWATEAAAGGATEGPDAFAVLDDELVLHVLTFLPGHDLARVSLLNRAWNQRASSCWVWKSLGTRDFGKLGVPFPTVEALQAGGGGKFQYARFDALKGLRKAGWTKVSESPQERREAHGSCVVGHMFLVWSGFCPDCDVIGLDTRNPDQGWKSFKTRGCQPRYGHTMDVLDSSRIVVFGGMTRGGYGGETSEMFVLRTHGDPSLWPSTLTFEAEELNPASNVNGIERGYHCSFLHNGKLYVFGGLHDRGSIGEFECFDFADNAWSPVALGPTTSSSAQVEPPPRFGHTASKIGDSFVVVAGGGVGSDPVRNVDDLSDVWKFDLESSVWTKMTPTGDFNPLTIGCCHTASVVGEKIIYFGGSSHCCSEVAVLDTSTWTWSTPKLFGSPPAGRLSHCSVVADMKLFVFGGWNMARNSMGDLYTLDLALCQKDADLQHLFPTVSLRNPRLANMFSDQDIRRILLQQLTGEGAPGLDDDAGPSDDGDSDIGDNSDDDGDVSTDGDGTADEGHDQPRPILMDANENCAVM